jgi:outer membrane receptor for ferrienterochelin and colicins
MRFPGLALVIVMSSWPAPSRADEPAYSGDVEELDLEALLDTPTTVWTAAKTEQKNYDAPAIITTVTREQIEVWGYRTLAEVLSHMLGFYPVDDHVSPNLAVRGISGGLYADSSIVKVLIDGHSVAFNSTGGNSLGPELIPLSAIKSIEIVPGPSSALFGADAFLGVINIKTRSGASVNGATARLSAGRVGQKLATDVDASAGAQKGAIDYLLAVRRNSEDLSGLMLPGSSPAPSVPIYNVGATEAHGLDQVSTSALGRLTYRRGRQTELGLFGYFSSMERGAEFGSLFQLAHAYTERKTLSENRVSLSQVRGGLFLHQDLGASARLSVLGSLFRGGPGDDNRLEVGSAFYYVRRRFGFRGGDLDAQIDWAPPWPPVRKMRVTIGASTSIDDELLPSPVGVAKEAVGDRQAGDALDVATVYQGRKLLINNGAYAQWMWNLLPDLLSVTGGLRYDRHNVYGGQLSGRVGLVSNPSPLLHMKLLYGSAFKAPSPTLLYAVPSAVGDVVGNAQLKPQYVRTLELQVAVEPFAFLSLTSDVAYSVLSDKTEFVQQGISEVARNVARAESVSWETRLEAKYQGMLRAHLAFEAQRTIRKTGQDGYAAEVVGEAGGIYPRYMMHTGLVIQPARFPLRTAVQASYVGTRGASDTNILLNGTPYDLPPYFLLEATISTIAFDPFGATNPVFSFAVTGKNLLNVGGPDPGFSGVDYPLRPRSLFLQMNVGY